MFKAVQIIDISPHGEIGRHGLIAPFHSARVIRLALGFIDRGRSFIFEAAPGFQGFFSKSNGAVSRAGRVAVPHFGAVPIFIARSFADEHVFPGFFGFRSVWRRLIGGQHKIFRGRKHAPGVTVGRISGFRVAVAVPLQKFGIAVIGAGPRAAFDVDHIIGIGRKFIEVILNAGARESFWFRFNPVDEPAEIIVIISPGAAAEIIAVMVQDDKQRMFRIGIIFFELAHYLFVIKRAESAAAVFIAHVAVGRHSYHFSGFAAWCSRRLSGSGVFIGYIVRPVRPRRNLRRRPQARKLDPVFRIGVNLVGRVGRV